MSSIPATPEPVCIPATNTLLYFLFHLKAFTIRINRFCQTETDTIGKKVIYVCCKFLLGTRQTNILSVHKRIRDSVTA